jgi:hypothetical protein
VHRFRLPLLLLVLLSALAFAPGAARPSSTAIELKGSVGPGFRITLTDANGITVSHLDPGAYHITVTNLSDPNTGVVHNFHLKGPAVDLATTSDAGTTSWDVTFTDGTYTYLCDFHPLQMRNTFTVGNAPPPPKVTKLKGTVGPRASISLKKGSSVVRSLKKGKYSIAVNDATAKDNFHLKGPGVSKKTSVAKRVKVTWKVTLRRGKYTYFSDAHKKLKRTFSVK